MKNIDEKIQKIIIKGYIYFIYSPNLNKIYVGETRNMSRINIYSSINECQDSKDRIRLYNFYSKHKTISVDLLHDLINKNNEFIVEYYETKYHNHLEKSYINYLHYSGYDLYNKKLYRSHIFDLDEIDMDYIDNMKLKRNDYIENLNMTILESRDRVRRLVRIMKGCPDLDNLRSNKLP